MDNISKPFTSDWLDAEAKRKRDETYDRIKKGEVKKEVKLTKEERIRKDIDELYIKCLNSNTNWGWFVDEVVKYVIKRLNT